MSRHRGVTLVELLVALVVGIMVLAGAAVVLKGSLAADRRLSDTSTLYSRVRGAYELMLVELRHARAIESGTEEDLAFRAVIEGESHRYRYAIVDEGDRTWLARSVDGAPAERLLPSVETLRFTYLAPGGAQVPGPVGPDADVRALEVELSTRLPGDTPPIRFINRVSLRNL